MSNTFGQNLSSSSINEPPATRMKPDFSGSKLPWGRAYIQTFMTPGHMRRESGESLGSGRGTSLSRESRTEDDRFFRFADETFLEQSRFGTSMDVALQALPPYPCELNMTATQFLEPDDSFYAGKSLQCFDTCQSEILTKI